MHALSIVIPKIIICAGPDPCQSGPCHVRATCEREDPITDSFNCTCQSPFIGDGFSCSGNQSYIDSILAYWHNCILMSLFGHQIISCYVNCAVSVSSGNSMQQYDTTHEVCGLMLIKRRMTNTLATA